jgi:UDPglucose 6-dehydrogenase
MGLDKRIGPKFLHPGPGYGGSCFPKDTRALAALGTSRGAPQRIVEAAIDANARQRQLIVDKVDRALGGAAGRQVAILGLAFKPNTDDVRESPGVFVCRQLARAGAVVRAFDPVAGQRAAEALADLGGAITFPPSAYDAIERSDAVVIMTEWNEFRGLDLQRVKALMAQPVIVDSRNVLDPAQTKALGFAYFCTGRERSASYEPVGA